MNDNQERVSIHINIEIAPETLMTIVSNAKQKCGPDGTGNYRVDTADAVSDLITKFLVQKEFLAYAEDINNY